MDKEIAFIASLFYFSVEEAKIWISKHTTKEIDILFNKYMGEE